MAVLIHHSKHVPTSRHRVPQHSSITERAWSAVQADHRGHDLSVRLLRHNTGRAARYAPWVSCTVTSRLNNSMSRRIDACSQEPLVNLSRFLIRCEHEVQSTTYKRYATLHPRSSTSCIKELYMWWYNFV